MTMIFDAQEIMFGGARERGFRISLSMISLLL